MPPSSPARDLRVEEAADILPHIRQCRGHPVLFDVDLAHLYELPAARLRELMEGCSPVPGEFCFALEREERGRAAADDPRAESAQYAFTAQGCFLMAVVAKTPAAKSRRGAVLAAFTRWRAAAGKDPPGGRKPAGP